MSHVSRMMHMRLCAMQRNLLAGYDNDNFCMFDASGLWASDYKIMPGY